MKRIYIAPTITIPQLSDDLMRTGYVAWSLGTADSNDQKWETVELHPVQEGTDWLNRKNGEAGQAAWDTDIWGKSE